MFNIIYIVSRFPLCASYLIFRIAGNDMKLYDLEKHERNPEYAIKWHVYLIVAYK